MSDCATDEICKPLAAVWQRLLTPLLVQLDAQLDRRLVATFSQAVRAIIEHRHRNHGLLLSRAVAPRARRSETPTAPAMPGGVWL